MVNWFFLIEIGPAIVLGWFIIPVGLFLGADDKGVLPPRETKIFMLIGAPWFLVVLGWAGILEYFHEMIVPPKESLQIVVIICLAAFVLGLSMEFRRLAWARILKFVATGADWVHQKLA